MGSTRCRHFVQNAWKKDLCSNCFKSRDEHVARTTAAAAPTATARPASAPVQGILKGATGSWTRSSKSHKVYFPAEECEVIGEGGEDAGPPSDEDDDRPDDDDDDWSSPLVDEDPQDREEEKLLQALTRSNTDFNSVAANLLEGSAAVPADPRGGSKARVAPGPGAPLQLGRPQTDSAGKKQTLLVSVQPFGGKPQPQHVTKIHTADIAAVPEKLVHISSSPAPAAPASESSSSSKSSSKSSTARTNASAEPSESPSLRVPFEIPRPAMVEDAKKKNNGVVVVAAAVAACVETSSPSPALPTSPVPSPTPPSLLKSPSDAQACTERSPPSPAAPQISSKHIFLKSIVDSEPEEVAHKPAGAPPPTIVAASLTPVNGSANNTINNNSNNNKQTGVYVSPVRREGKRTLITRATPISKSNELLLKTKFIPLRTSAILNKTSGASDLSLNKLNNNNKNNKVESLKNERNEAENNINNNTNAVVVGFQLQPREPVMKQALGSSSSSSDEDEHTYSNVQEGAQTKRLSSLLAAASLSVGSRELAGEPDGRADPDSSSESSGGEQPPALPQSPPPAVDPRPSFLHGLTARIAAAEKPKVPFKSNSVLQRWSQAEQGGIAVKQGLAAAQEAAELPELLVQSPPCSPPLTPMEGSPESSPLESPRDSLHESPVVSPLDSPQESPQGSPQCTPQGSPQGGGDAASRSQKRQAPKPPQTPSEEAALEPLQEAPAIEQQDNTPLFYSRTSHPSLLAAKESPAESINKDSSGSGSGGKRRGLGLGLSRVPLHTPPVRSESVPSALGQVALGQSVTLGARSGHSIAKALAQSLSPAPQPSPRRALSLSTDSLSSPPTKHVISYDTERKKVGTKVRFSLRKFLGLTKEGVREELGGPHALAHAAHATGEVAGPPQPRPRPRLEIIHPSDLSGTAVEVLRGSGLEVRRQLQEAAQAAHRRSSEGSAAVAAAGGRAGSPASEQADRDAAKGRPTKPPPPPRSQSLDSDRADTASIGRPSRPPPPKTSDLLRRQKQPPSPPVPPTFSVYANLAPVPGEVRSGMAPLKPQRTGSVRDASLEGPKRTPLPMDKEQQTQIQTQGRAGSLAAQQPEDSGYESVELSDTAQPHSMTDSENVYECVNGSGSSEAAERSSSPECDSKRRRPSSSPSSLGSGLGCGPQEQTPSAPARYAQHRRSEGGDAKPEAADYPRLGFSSFGRPASVPYCGSETESDIYSPYSFYGSEEGDDGDGDTSLPVSANQTSWKWRRKGRSIVHKSMEDNYGAVVGANHEALAQLLEQIRTGPSVPPSLRPLKALGTLSWRDFSLESGGSGVHATMAGRWLFFPAQWGSHSVTLSVLPDWSPAGAGARTRRGRGPFALMPIAEFRDFVPAAYLSQAQRPPAPSNNNVQAYVGVLARVRVETLSSYGAWLESQIADPDAAVGTEEVWREAGVAMLQLVNALKSLQAMGTEEASTDSIVFLRDHATAGAIHTAQLAMLYTPHHSVEEEDGSRSLCQCALLAAQKLLPSAPTFDLLASLLSKERAESLSRAKSVLEFWLWGPGPGDNAPSLSPFRGPAAPAGREREKEAALQRWLDLERATVLHRLVCARASAAGPGHRLSIPQQSHLLFLVHTSAKNMCDASQLLDAQSVSPLEAANF